MNKNLLKLITVLLAVLCLVLMCNCQKSPVTVPVNPGFSGNTGEGDDVIDDRDVTETEVETTNISNSTWLLLGQKIIDKLAFLYIFTLLAVIIYKWVRDGSIGILGSGRK